MTETLNLNCFR